ncbi:MAG: DUF4843 domain-containing protein [Rikenellaceae bacterium]
MKNKILFRFSALLAVAALFCSCDDTWLMYDTDQKSHLYFIDKSGTSQFSFALLQDQQSEYNMTVKLMGMPSDQDRTFDISYIDAEAGETLMSGSTEYPVVTAVEGEDFIMNDLVIPAGEVEVVIPITINRTDKMMDSFVKLQFEIVENDEFIPLAADSSESKEILTPMFTLYINDGEPSCPYWWDASTTTYDLFGWTMYGGRFYPEKYLMFLELYWAIEEVNPVFYEYCEALYGRNLDNEGITNSFFSVSDGAVWATYVLIPLRDYYVEYYENNPDDPDIEVFASSGTSGSYWGDPIKLLR